MQNPGRPQQPAAPGAQLAQAVSRRSITERVLGWDPGDTPGDKTQRGVAAVSYLLIAGMFSCSIVLAQSVPDDSDVSGLGVGLTAFLLFGAAAAVGAALGFLFGLPRSRYAEQSTSNITAAQPGANGSATDTPKSGHYLTNSNLVKVSDWLTTIIVGVGLVNLAKIGPAAGDLSNTLEEALGGAAYAGIIGVSVMVIALLASLILCYLWTSVRVRELLEESENQLGGAIPSLIGRTVLDAKAALGETTLRLVSDGSTDDEIVTAPEPPPGAPATIGATISVQSTTREAAPSGLTQT
jgi:hypothetical protein